MKRRVGALEDEVKTLGVIVHQLVTDTEKDKAEPPPPAQLYNAMGGT